MRNGRHTRADPAHRATKNAFRHGLAGIAQRRVDGVLNPAEQSVREEILSGLLADSRGAMQHRHARAGRDNRERCVAAVTFNHAIDGVIQDKPESRANEAETIP